MNIKTVLIILQHKASRGTGDGIVFPKGSATWVGWNCVNVSLFVNSELFENYQIQYTIEQ